MSDEGIEDGGEWGGLGKHEEETKEEDDGEEWQQPPLLADAEEESDMMQDCDPRHARSIEVVECLHATSAIPGTRSIRGDPLVVYCAAGDCADAPSPYPSSFPRVFHC